MFARALRHSSSKSLSSLSCKAITVPCARKVSTLENNPHVYVFPDDRSISNHILSLLPNSPPRRHLAIGTTGQLPPAPTSLVENHEFLTILQSVLAENACQDQSVISQAQAMASTSGANLGSGGAFFPNQRQRRNRSSSGYGGGAGIGGDGAGGASAQGGAGGAGRGGYIHVYDQRHPPDFGRIPEPEDIFGSLEVDGVGNFVDGHGRYQASGTYRIVTNDGVLGLTPFLRGKLIERLKLEQAAME